jgi:hypothetical protein
MPNETIAANTAATTVVPTSTIRRNFRLSMISASAPAGSAKRNIGSAFATWTIDTISGFGLRLVMSQPEPALYIQKPMFEMTVAVHSTANVA